jgi:hypothetical protein
LEAAEGQVLLTPFHGPNEVAVQAQSVCQRFLRVGLLDTQLPNALPEPLLQVFHSQSVACSLSISLTVISGPVITGVELDDIIRARHPVATSIRRRTMRLNSLVLLLFMFVTITLAYCIPLNAQQASMAEAQNEMATFWGRKVSVCNGQLVTKYPAGDWKFLRNGHTVLNPRSISQVDALNGIQWQGTTTLTADAIRGRVPSGGYSQWLPGISVASFEVRMRKVNGRWTMTPDPYSAIDQMIAPQCSSIPKEPTAADMAVAMDRQQQEMCRLSKPAEYQVVALEQYVQRDTTACKDSDGHTLLMMHLDAAASGFENASYIIMRSGVDLNVRDNQGWTALRHAVSAYYKSYTNEFLEASYRRVINELKERGADQENLFSPDGKIIPANINLAKPKKQLQHPRD